MSRCRIPLLLFGVLLATRAAAVPIPWKNCGSPTDLLSIAQFDTSVWPPPVAAPASATATFDAAGNLINLRVFLIHGVEWAFDSGPLPTTTNAGFVSLPASFPVTVKNPALPLAAGPYDTTRTFGPPPVTIRSRGNLAAQVHAPVTATASLSFNGTPGFPLTPVAGTPYAIHVQMSEAGGPAVFCMDLVIPFKTAAPFVTVEQTFEVPTLSRAGEIVLAVMLLTLPVALARRRR